MAIGKRACPDPTLAVARSGGAFSELGVANVQEQAIWNDTTPVNDSAIRKDIDSLGAVAVPAGKLWGAQTKRTLVVSHFTIGNDIRLLSCGPCAGWDSPSSTSRRTNLAHRSCPET